MKEAIIEVILLVGCVLFYQLVLKCYETLLVIKLKSDEKKGMKVKESFSIYLTLIMFDKFYIKQIFVHSFIKTRRIRVSFILLR